MGISTHEKSHIEIKAEMIQKAKANPTKFLTDITDHTVEWKGTVLDAIDDGIFVMKMKNGMNRWHWGKGDFVGEEIAIVQASEDPFEALLRAMSEGDLSIYYEQLKIISRSDKINKNTSNQLEKIKENEDRIPVDDTQPELPSKTIGESELTPTFLLDFLVGKEAVEVKEGVAFWTTGDLAEIGPVDEIEAVASGNNKIYKRMRLGYNRLKKK